jgi:hypothetical protein
MLKSTRVHQVSSKDLRVEVKMRNLTRQFTRSDDRQNTGDRSTCCVINVTNKMSLPVSARQRE